VRFINTEIPDVVIIEPCVFGDERGFFMETWQRKTFAENGIDFDFVQDNHSLSGKGILRGLHYQIRKPQGKLVRVVEGEVFDVAVDIRSGSKWFGKWVGVRLSDENQRMLWVPPGFAHGFYVLSDRATFMYKCTDYYAPEHERCIVWNDPDLNIAWPLDGEPVISGKDLQGAHLVEVEVFQEGFTFRHALTKAGQ
jgi:dTDP-4-dehydrorhamnose 3,5-epimerase